jgi:hypothetical protein
MDSLSGHRKEMGSLSVRGGVGRVIRWTAGSIACILASMVLFSCDMTMLDEQMVINVKDDVLPAIQILSPEENSYCAKQVVVTGIVTDTADGGREPGRVESVRFSVAPSQISDDITFDTDGGFTFSFSTENLGATFLLLITALDWNGNESEVALSLRKLENNDIPSFSVTPNNRHVELVWDAVPFAESYHVYYTSDGTLPSESYGSLLGNVDSPCLVPDLENGKLYTFLLEARSGTGESNRSGFEQAIPLSVNSLVPEIEEGFERIALNWQNIPGTDKFEVWRAIGRSSTWNNISGTLSSTSFTDFQVTEGFVYRYKVRPAMENGIFSSFGAGSPSPFPESVARRVSTRDTNSALGIDVEGNILALADGNGLKTFDISEPGSPQPLGSISLTDVRDVALMGEYAYLSQGTNFTVVRVTPSEPLETVYSIGTATTTASAADDIFACVVKSARIMCYDVTDPVNPVYADTGILIGGSVPSDVDIEQGFVYVAYGSRFDIQSIDPDDGFTPLATLDMTNAVGCDAEDGYLYVADSMEGLLIYDVATPSSPVPKGTFIMSGALRVAVSGPVAYVTTSNRLHVISVASATEPIEMASFSLSEGSNVAAAGSYIYVADGSSGFKTYEVTMPLSPKQAASTTDSGFNSLAVLGDYCYLSGTRTTVIDLYDPTNPITRGNRFSGGHHIEAVGDYLYVADADYSSGGLKIYTVADPDAPDLIGVVGAGSSRGIAMQGDYAYLANEYDGLYVIDVADPEHPSITGLTSVSGRAWNVDVQGDYAYVASSDGLHIVDIRNSEEPALVKDFPLSDGYSVQVSGNLAYVGSSDAFSIIDVTDPYAPSILKTFSGNYTHLNIRGSYAYVSRFVYGQTNNAFKIFWVGDPASAFEVTALPMSGPGEVWVSGCYAYIRDYKDLNYYLRIVDLTAD